MNLLLHMSKKLIKIYIEYIQYDIIVGTTMNCLHDDIMRLVLNDLTDRSFINFVNVNKYNSRYSKFKLIVNKYNMIDVMGVINKYAFTYIHYNYEGCSNFKFFPDTIQKIDFGGSFHGYLGGIYNLPDIRDIYLRVTYPKFKYIPNIPTRIKVHLIKSEPRHARFFSVIKKNYNAYLTNDNES